MLFKLFEEMVVAGLTIPCHLHHCQLFLEAHTRSSSASTPQRLFCSHQVLPRGGRSSLVVPRKFRELGVMATSKSIASPDNVAWQKVTIPNSAGEVLVGILDDIGSEDIIVLCHGFRSSKASTTLINLTSALLGVGLSTFRFDFSGNGESEGEFQYGNYWKEVEDLRSVVLYWVGQGRRVKAIIGHSKGGNAVLLYASKYRDVYTVLNLSGRLSLERGMKERLGENFFERIEECGYLEVKDKYGNLEYRVTKESLKERLNTDMKSSISSIPEDCRVLTVHGSEDEVVSMEDANEFDNIIPNHMLQIMDGANHVYSQHQRDLASIVVDFIQDGLGRCSDDRKKVEL